ncbi:MAG: GNAT family N-acetyltransferase [Acidobacteriota bacterium]
MKPTYQEARIELTIHPLTARRWGDVERLFGLKGACGGCWCMYWRLKRSEFETGKGPGNKARFRKIVTTGPAPGLLAYYRNLPVAWCAMGPRADYSTLARSRVLKPVDDRPVWSIVCFFVSKEHRSKGISVQLLKAAVKQARKAGAGVLEGYPVEPSAGQMADAFAWTGLASAFRRAGFVEVARRSPTRPIMRYELQSAT